MTQFQAGTSRFLTGGRHDYLPLLLDADELGHGISNNPHRFWDIEHARRVLAYDPQDAAPMLIGDEVSE